MCWISVPRGCLPRICSFNVSLNILFGYWARSAPAAGSVWLLNLLRFLAMPGWASAGWEHQLGGFLGVVCIRFFKLRRSWRHSSLLLPRTWAPVIFQMHSWKRACSENWQIIVQWPGGNDHCSSFIMQILRCLQKCGKLKMMAVVRTSLQKVVVLLHRLQRMAVSSPRYQKLCKVIGDWK